jgi:hypothetical protein
MANWIDLLRDGPNPADIGGAFVQGQAQAQALRSAQLADVQRRQAVADQQQYRSRVQSLLTGGDIKGAAAQAAAFGDDKASTNFIALQKNQYDQGATGAGAMGEVVRGISSLPYEQRRGALAAAAPTLQAMGYGQDQIAAFDPTDANLSAVGGLGYSAKDRAGDQQGEFNGDTARIAANNPVVVGGSLVTRGGQEIFRAPETISAPMDNNVYQVPGTNSQGYTGTLSPGSITAEQLYSAAIEPQESGGRAGAIGPQTRYGRAQGASQMLPATAQSMAAKIGVPWRPEMMTAKTTEGLQYQRQLGVAYAQEALDKTGGDPKQAAMFYHGGPNREIWGPRTRRYGDEVMTRLDRAIGQTATSRTPVQIQQGQLTPAQQAAAAKVTNGRPIPQGAGKDYQKEVDQYRALTTAVGTFKDGFGGNMAGGIENIAQGIYSGIGTEGQRDWWAAFRATDNVIRNGLFGSALTEHEKQAYEATTISPSMDPKEIRRNLVRRQGIIKNAVARKQRFLAAQGFSREAITDLAGEDLGGIGSGGSSRGNSGGSSAPAQAQAMLRSNPGLRAQYERKYGAGSAAAVLGR